MEDCLICHDNILDQPVSALACGHVYHRNCIASWLKQSRGECPQCKQLCLVPEDLVFDTAFALHASNSELQADRQATREERRRNHLELNQQQQHHLETLAKDRERCQQADTEANELKLRRRELQRQEAPCEAKLQRLDERLKEAEKKSAEMRFHLDAVHHQHFSKLPVTEPREGDECAQSAKRKLHKAQQAGRRVTDLTRELHGDSVSSWTNQSEGQLLAQRRNTAVKEVEAEVRNLRSQVEEVRKQRSEMQALQAQDLELSDEGDDLSQRTKAPSAPSPAMSRSNSRSSTVTTVTTTASASAGTPTSPASPMVASVLNVLNRRPATPSQNAGGKRAQEEEEEDLLLFGGPAKLQRKGSGGFGRATAPAKPAVLPAPQVTLRRPPRARKSSSIKTLFEQF